MVKKTDRSKGVFSNMDMPHVRQITSGPKHHWFGYYDKLQIDDGNRRVLAMAVDFEHRSPNPDDEIEIGFVDLQDGDKWTKLGTTTSWNWQQGCMLQWVPGTTSQVIWNERGENGYTCRVLDIETNVSNTFPWPIYALGPDGTWGVSTDFRRLNDTRPGYGYSGIEDPFKSDIAPEDTGIWRVDFTNGQINLLFSVADAARLTGNLIDSNQNKQWFNHLVVSPEGNRISFLHRYREPITESTSTRMITINNDGSDPFVVIPSAHTSHYIWRDEEHLLAWTNTPKEGYGFYIFKDKGSLVSSVGSGILIEDGHCTYLSDKRWILNDTYPDRERFQHVHLFDTVTGTKIPLADLHSPFPYTGEWRCDTHPRSSADGTKIVVDSPHGGDGRQLHMIDIGEYIS